MTKTAAIIGAGQIGYANAFAYVFAGAGDFRDASQPLGETAPVRTTADTVARDAEVEHQVFEYGEHQMGLTIDQDLEIMPGQQAGFRSRAYRGAYLAGQESRLSRYHELIDDYIDGVRPLKKA